MLAEPCFVVDNSVEQTVWERLTIHLRTMAAAIRYPVRIAFISCDEFEMQYGPKYIENEPELLLVMAHRPFSSSHLVLPSLQRVLSHVETAHQSQPAYPLYLLTGEICPNLQIADGAHMLGELDLVCFVYGRAGLVVRWTNEVGNVPARVDVDKNSPNVQ